MLVRFLTFGHSGLRKPIFGQKEALLRLCIYYNLKTAKNGFSKPQMAKSQKTD